MTLTKWSALKTEIQVTCKDCVQTGSTNIEICVEFPGEVKIIPPQNLAIPFLSIYPHDSTSYYRDTCLSVFIFPLLLIARSWKESRYLPTDEWVMKIYYIYTMNYYSSVKKNDNMKFAGKSRKLEIIFLRVINHTQKEKYCIFLYMNV